MIVSKHIDELRNAIQELKSSNESTTVGFVPTMGALHEGHLSLVKKASEQTDIVIVSIFVNPAQFNDKSDLAKYPRTIEDDIKKLESTDCKVLFFPTEDVIYPDGIPDYKIDLNGLDKVMEGKYRDDHFDGVCMVVERLFEIVQPDKAFFGLKDFQQLAIIKHMVMVRNLDVEIVPVPIVRSEQGLALSSRNALLDDNHQNAALKIYQTLQLAVEWAPKYESVKKMQDDLIQFFNQGELELEYLEIVDNDTLQPVDEIRPGISCCIAAYCGSVRLIDNIQLL